MREFLLSEDPDHYAWAMGNVGGQKVTNGDLLSLCFNAGMGNMARDGQAIHGHN